MDRIRDKKILIVEDSQSVQVELQELFTRLGMKVVGVASNGVEAIKLVSELEPDLVSLDIIMPEMDGIECYRHLRQSDPERPFLFFVTALATEARVVSEYAEEIDPSLYMPKPLTERGFLEKIGKIYLSDADIEEKELF